MRRTQDELHIAHITSGCPASPAAALSAGFRSRSEYAAARQNELLAALRLAGLQNACCTRFGFVDQRTSFHLPAVVDRLRRLIRRWHPATVLSPAYEGGHPDHDTAAFAVALINKELPGPFRHLEYRLYHAGPNGEFVADRFLDPRRGPVQTLRFSAAEQHLKSCMLAAFRSQWPFLQRFPVANEQIRPAPVYDFTTPPHPGRLLYETWGWQLQGDEWRRLAASFAGSR